MGSENHEEDVTFVSESITIKGIVDIDSFNTGDGAENEVNRSIVKLCTIYCSSILLPSIPKMYDKIYQVSEEITWSIKQINREHGMYTFACTADDNRRRGRSR